MKKLFIIMSMFLTMGSLVASETEYKEQSSNLCELFTEKVKSYKLKMHRDMYANAALALYEKKAKIACSEKK